MEQRSLQAVISVIGSKLAPQDQFPNVRKDTISAIGSEPTLHFRLAKIYFDRYGKGLMSVCQYDDSWIEA